MGGDWWARERRWQGKCILIDSFWSLRSFGYHWPWKPPVRLVGMRCRGISILLWLCFCLEGKFLTVLLGFHCSMLRPLALLLFFLSDSQPWWVCDINFTDPDNCYLNYLSCWERLLEGVGHWCRRHWWYSVLSSMPSEPWTSEGQMTVKKLRAPF